MTDSDSVQGMDQINKNLAAIAKRVGINVAQAAFVGGQMVRAEAIDSIQSSSPGKEVSRTRAGGNTYKHIAAGPGEAPNTDTGRLVNSIQVEVKQNDVYVGSSLGYAPDLEFGTSKMAARPWLNPALESNKDKIKKLMKEGVNGALR